MGAKEDRPSRVAIYARTSAAGQNTAMQIEELRSLAEQRGWHVVGEYVDHGQSGAKHRRPELDRMMDDIKRGRIDVLAVWKFDRLARSVRHLVVTLDELRARNIDFLSMHDGIDTSTPAGRFTFHVVAAVAELEREMIRERTRSGLRAARRRGARIGRPRVRVDLAKALHMRRQGKSLREIAKALKVGKSTVQKVLQEAEASGSEHAA